MDPPLTRKVLHLATSSPDEELLAMLVSHATAEGDGGVNMRDNCGRAPLHDAAEVGSPHPNLNLYPNPNPNALMP